MTYNFSYPPEIIRRSAKMAETSQLGGYEWGPRWGSWNLYIRLYGGDGTKAQIKAAVMRRATTISNALEMDYPRATAPEVNAVFSEILSQSEAQTMAYGLPRVG